MHENNENIPNHFIVLIPGYMGSKLRSQSTGEIVWLNLLNLLKNPLQIDVAVDKLFCDLKYPNQDLTPAGIMDQMIFLPPLFKQEHYGRLMNALKKMGYQKESELITLDKPHVYTFAYDWRQDNRISAKQLGIAINKWRSWHKNAHVWIIAHSNGGIVARWYIEKEGGKGLVDRLFLLGSPWDGAPKALEVLLSGPEIFLLKLFNQFNVNHLMQEAMLSFPSFYQLIPFYETFLSDRAGHALNPFEEKVWLQSEQQCHLLDNAKEFYTELGKTLSVETYCFFGIKQPTTSNGVIQIGNHGKWESIDWKGVEPGDGTIPIHSAVHMGASEKLPFMVAHGDIYANQAVLDKLEWELRTKFSEDISEQAIKISYNLIIYFEIDKDQYAPNDSIHLVLAITNKKPKEPVTQAAISVRMEWIQGIPQFSETPPCNFPFVSFPTTSNEKGRFEADVNAPEIPGYYRLVAMIETNPNEIFILNDTILVEPIESDWYQ